MNTTTININGTSYTLDVPKAIKEGYLKPIKKIQVGDFFKYTSPETKKPQICQLVIVDYDNNGNYLMCMIMIEKGNRFCNPVKVKNAHDLSREEWLQIIPTTSEDLVIPIQVKIEEAHEAQPFVS